MRLAPIVFIAVAGCAGGATAPTAGRTEGSGESAPQLVFISSLNPVGVVMIVAPTVAKFHGTSNPLSILFPPERGRRLLRTLAALPLNKKQYVPEYNSGVCYVVEIFYPDRAVTGFMFHRGDSALSRWFDEHMADKRRYMCWLPIDSTP